MLNVIETLSEEILSVPATRLYTVLRGPTLVHLKGRQKRPLFLSVLLHGNETTGWEVVRNLLYKYKDETLPRALSIFIGNIRAARYGKRRLERQPDYNRLWDGGDSEEAAMVQEIITVMSRREVFASIDIHNNSGINPHYACINRLDRRYLHLARVFSRTIIYFIRPRGVQSLAFAELCPATTLECGQPGDEYGIQLATRFVDNILNIDRHPESPVDENDIDLFHTVGIVHVSEEISFSFDGEPADIMFVNDFKVLNFQEIAPDSRLATLREGITQPLSVLDENGEEIFNELFEIRNGGLYTRAGLMPSMLSTDKWIIRQDCLCYLLERYSLDRGEKIMTDDRRLWS